MAIRYKGDILGALKERGYSSSRLRNEKIFGEKTMQDFRRNAAIPYKTLNKLCELLGCQVGDIVEYVPESGGENSSGEN